MTDINQIVTALTPLANKIGIGGQFIFEAACRKQILIDVFSSFAFLLGSILLFCLCFIGLKNEKRNKNGKIDEESFICALAIILLGITSVVVSIYNFLCIFTYKYDAIIAIISSLKG